MSLVSSICFLFTKTSVNDHHHRFTGLRENQSTHMETLDSSVPKQKPRADNATAQSNRFYLLHLGRYFSIQSKSFPPRSLGSIQFSLHTEINALEIAKVWTVNHKSPDYAEKSKKSGVLRDKRWHYQSAQEVKSLQAPDRVLPTSCHLIRVPPGLLIASLETLTALPMLVLVCSTLFLAPCGSSSILQFVSSVLQVILVSLRLSTDHVDDCIHPKDYPSAPSRFLLLEV